jgi:hypothetical protein
VVVLTREKDMVLNPIWRRSIEALALTLATVAWSAVVLAQQPAPAPAAKAPSPAVKAAPAKAAAAKKKAPAAGTLDAVAAQAEVEAGVAALAQGHAESAVDHLTSAISSSSLPAAQSARALYYRGVAYRRHAKPAQAISDLTGALWIKAGLTEEQRADALQQRSAAYREAGLPDQSAPDSSAATSKSGRMAGSTTTLFASVAPAPPATQSSGGGGFFSTLFGGSGSSAPAPQPVQPAPKAAVAAVRPAAPPAAASATGSTPAAVVAASTEAGTAKPATRMVPITPVESNLPLGFHDLPGISREVEVNTAGRAAPAPVAVAKSWESATQVKPAPAVRKAAPSVPAASGVGPARVAGGPVVASSGKVQVQVASVRTAQEAQGVAARLQSSFQRELAGRSPVVEQTTAGNIGTLYRVQVGPFASAQDTVPLCTKLRSEGLDCRVQGP